MAVVAIALLSSMTILGAGVGAVGAQEDVDDNETSVPETGPHDRADLERSGAQVANEYVGEDIDDGDVPDASDQAHVAMRPALSELDERQELTLEKLLDGFEDDDELLHWALIASQSSFAELDGQFASALEAEKNTRDMLVGRADDDLSAEFREDVAANDLIPSFNAAARSVVDGAAEADATAAGGDAKGGSIS